MADTTRPAYAVGDAPPATGLRHDRPRPRAWLLGALPVACIALTAWAAPILARRAPLPGDILSVRDMHRARLNVEPLPRALVTAGVTEDKIRILLTNKLHEGGLTIGNDPDLPQLNFRARLVNDAEDEERVALVFLLEAQQRVKLYRLGEDLRVPTYTGGAMAVTDRAHLVEVATSKAREVASAMVGAVRHAGRQ